MIGAELFLACHDAKTGELYGDVEPCSMCKRMILNAGIKRVYIRQTSSGYKMIETGDWVIFDESLKLNEGY